MESLPVSLPQLFLSTPSARRATGVIPDGHAGIEISIHALREEGDASASGCSSTGSNFYPRPPRGGRLFVCHLLILLCIFLSTPSARRATGGPPLFFYHGGISIHALREEGDASVVAALDTLEKFLSTPSARRATLLSMGIVPGMCLFLSTPSARRATLSRLIGTFLISIFLSTPSARRATLSGCR